MTSGEVLFILAFIVLPTAVLVSSIWAVVFVRRRPDRVVKTRPDDIQVQHDHEPAEQAPGFAEEDTVVVPVTARPAHQRATSMEPEVTDVAEYDDAYETPLADPWDQQPAEQTETETVDYVEGYGHADLQGPAMPDDDIPAPQESQADPLESEIVQTTEDLDDVVAGLAALDSTDDEPPLGVTEDEPAAPVETGTDEEVETLPDEFHETSELPVIETHADEAAAAAAGEEPAPADDDRRTSWRRRRDVKLRPADQDGTRQRGRNREPQRQVPQLGRTPRRGDTEQQPGSTDSSSGADDPPPGDR